MSIMRTATHGLCLTLLIVIDLSQSAGAPAQSGSATFDLSKLGPSRGCLSKGRLQDPEYNDSGVASEIVAGGKQSVPVLIELIRNRTKTSQPVFCYWSETTVGDLAFFVLYDLFLDSSAQHSTVPGTRLDELVGKQIDAAAPFETHFRDYLAKNGYVSLQIKWKKIWAKYHDKVDWDPKEMCYKIADKQRRH